MILDQHHCTFWIKSDCFNGIEILQDAEVHNISEFQSQINQKVKIMTSVKLGPLQGYIVPIKGIIYIQCPENFTYNNFKLIGTIKKERDTNIFEDEIVQPEIIHDEIDEVEDDEIDEIEDEIDEIEDDEIDEIEDNEIEDDEIDEESEEEK